MHFKKSKEDITGTKSRDRYMDPEMNWIKSAIIHQYHDENPKVGAAWRDSGNHGEIVLPMAGLCSPWQDRDSRAARLKGDPRG